MNEVYEHLHNLYYIDQEQYKERYKERFNSESAVRIDFEVSGYPAFFMQTSDVTSLALFILRLDKDIYEISNRLPGKALSQYMIKCLIDEVVVTNNIEGVHSSRKDIFENLLDVENKSAEKGKADKFAGMTRRYNRLINGDDISIKSCEDIRALYEEVVLPEIMSDDPKNAPDGKIFRKNPTSVHSVTDKIIHNGIMPESKIIENMEKAIAFYNDESIETLYRICIFHYMFEYIHPFYDGNGRLGRFIASYSISKTMQPIIAFRLSETIKENINKYYKAFEVCNDPKNLGDLTPFLIMMLDMIAKSMLELYQSLERKYDSWVISFRKIKALIREENIKLYGMYDLLVQGTLFGEGGISRKDLLKELQISDTTLRNYLKKIDQTLLKTKRAGHETLFSLDLAEIDRRSMNT